MPPPMNIGWTTTAVAGRPVSLVTTPTTEGGAYSDAAMSATITGIP